MKMMRIQDVCDYTTLCRSSVFKMVAANEFPQPLKLSYKVVAWQREDIDKWLASKKEQAND